MKSLRVDYDTSYGIDDKSGWSVAIDGHYLVQFERFLFVAISKAFWKHLFK